jgi:hypothetical protein
MLKESSCITQKKYANHIIIGDSNKNGRKVQSDLHSLPQQRNKSKQNENGFCMKQGDYAFGSIHLLCCHCAEKERNQGASIN